MYLPITAPVARNSMDPLDPDCLAYRRNRRAQVEAAAFEAASAVGRFTPPGSVASYGTNLVADVVQSQGRLEDKQTAPNSGGDSSGAAGAPVVVPLNPTGPQIPGSCNLPVAPKATVVMPRMIPAQRVHLAPDPIAPQHDLITVEDPIRPFNRAPFVASQWQQVFASILSVPQSVPIPPAPGVGYASYARGMGDVNPPWGDEFVLSGGDRASFMASTSGGLSGWGWLLIGGLIAGGIYAASGKR